MSQGRYSSDDIDRFGQSGLQTTFVVWMGRAAMASCLIFAASIVIADFVVPNHDLIADTISDLGAGKYEFIVDTGIYAFSAGLMALAMMASHAHPGGWRWTSGIIGLGALSLIVFLIGARNEYGDNDSDGVVIHVYLVYALGLLMTYVPWALSKAAGEVERKTGRRLIILAIVWAITAPIFFFLPDSIDGIYERMLGGIAFMFVFLLSTFLSRTARVVGESI